MPLPVRRAGEHRVEPVEKPLNARFQGIEGSFKVSFDIGQPRKSDCSAFYAMTFSELSKAILLRGFFYRLVMNKSYVVLLTVLVLILGGTNVQAKRMVPKEVPPVFYKGIKYLAPHWGTPSSRMGFIEARDEKTDKLLWDLKVYEIQYDPLLEDDAQDTFITSLKIVDDKLEVLNEDGDTFIVDLMKRKVIRRIRRK